MNFEINTSNHVQIITPLVKRLDASVSAQFKEEVLGHISHGHRTILLDFSRVDFIDSSCLGALISLLKTIRNDGDLVLCSLSNNIQNLFRLTRMDRIFTIYADQESALRLMDVNHLLSLK